jgi:hypothetical protein
MTSARNNSISHSVGSEVTRQLTHIASDLYDHQAETVGALWNELGSLKSGLTSQQESLQAANNELRRNLEWAHEELRRDKEATEAERASLVAQQIPLLDPFLVNHVTGASHYDCDAPGKMYTSQYHLQSHSQ